MIDIGATLQAVVGLGGGDGGNGTLGNLTAQNETFSITDSVPSTILESFLPGFGVVRRFLLVTVGFDIQLLVTTVFFLGLAVSAGRYAFAKMLELWDEFFTAFVGISSRERVYTDVMRWVSTNVVKQNTKHLTVATLRYGYYDPEDDETDPDSVPQVAYSPSYGDMAFWWKGRRFVFRRETNESKQSVFSYMETENIRFSISGRSAEPIKELIAECQRWAKRRKQGKTTIVCPDSMSSEWGRDIDRTSRPIETVYMDELVRSRLLKDAKKFVRKTTANFYASRGIPYRRGYLFWGPPGTGKSSLSFALAGILGYTIHYLSLNDNNLSDSKLRGLFNDMPARSIILMEDIDAVGLARKNLRTSSSGEIQFRGAMSTSSPTKSNGTGDKNKDKEGHEKVTLSGLLNAIDGVASAEGRILIMTTNDPEALDPALIRPGRVDMQVYFGFATRKHAFEMYMRFFPSEAEVEAENLLVAAAAAGTGEKREAVLPTQEMAGKFADQVPADTFTPAEIQGFLLEYSEDPQKALDKFPAWIELTRSQKASGKNVLKESSASAAKLSSGVASESAEAADKDVVVVDAADASSGGSEEAVPTDESQTEQVVPAGETKAETVKTEQDEAPELGFSDDTADDTATDTDSSSLPDKDDK